MKHAALVARELSSPVPQINVEQWWQAQTAARRSQMETATDGTAGGSATREVREHEIDVLRPPHFANRSSIRDSLLQLMPYLREALQTDMTRSGQSASDAVAASQTEQQGVTV